MRTDSLEKVLEGLVMTENTTLVIERQPGRKNASDVRLLGGREGVSPRSGA